MLPIEFDFKYTRIMNKERLNVVYKLLLDAISDQVGKIHSYCISLVHKIFKNIFIDKKCIIIFSRIYIILQFIRRKKKCSFTTTKSTVFK